MSRVLFIRDVVADVDYGIAVIGSASVAAFPVNPESDVWAKSVNQSGLSASDFETSLPYNLQVLASEPLSNVSTRFKSLIVEEHQSEFQNLCDSAEFANVGSLTESTHRYVVKTLNQQNRVASPVDSAISAFNSSSRQRVIDYKALSYRADSSFSNTMINVKRARALWDPNLGPSGGYRCPPGTQYGGYITDRFGRGCGGGALRRVGRALIDAGQGIESIGQRRDARRLERAAARAQRGENRRERVGAAARRGVAAVSNALERGAQRLVGEYQPRDYDPRTGRMRRRGIPPREISPDRRAAINSRLVEIADELNAIADGPRNPDAIRRERALVEENRRLRRERDGVAAQRVARVPAAPQRRRIVAREADRQRQRRQGARPVRKPVAERRRDGIMERAARRLVGEFRPSEYKPGDKERIRNRRNRYADVSDAQLRRALATNSPRKARPGEARNVEARRRQERLEILQEMVNRGLPIPEQYKREVAQYRLKPQRQRRREGLNRQGRAAVALERAAQRVEQRQQPGARRPAERRKPDALENQRRRIARARKNRPEGASDEEWNAYNEYLDSVPDGNFIPEGEAPQLEPVLSFGKWKRDVLPNMEPASRSKRRGILADMSDSDILAKLLAYRDDRKTPPFNMADLTDDEVGRLDEIVIGNRDKFRDLPDGRAHPAVFLVASEFNLLQDGERGNRPANAPSARSRIRSARVERANTSSLRRPQPKRQRGEQIDVEGMDRDQRARFRNIARDEKVKLDAEWRKRLGLKASEPITDAAIKKYIKDREDNKPGAYIGVLKAKGNDWKALDEYFKRIDNRPMAAAVAGENDLINRVGPKRRGEMVKAFNGPSSGRQRMIPRTPSPSSGGNRVPTAPSAPQAPNERPQNQRRYVPGAMGLNEVIELEQRPEFDFRGLPRALHLADFEVAVNALADSNQREKLEDMRKQLRRQANNLDAQMRKENDPGKRAKLLADFVRAREEQDLVNGAIRRQIANAGRPVATPPAVVEEARDVQDAIARISGSMPDSRSRRNVRNRFPKQGLPQRAFWRNPDWVEAVGQADADEHERRFGRYYGPDNEINARGRLINEQLRNEREAVNAGRVAPQAPAAPTTSSARPAPRRPRQPRQPRTPAPSGQENNEAPAGAPNPGNALPRLRPVQPRKRAENMPVLGKDGQPNDPLPTVEHPGGSSIKTAADAVAHLNNGLPLSDVPRELWWDALRENAKAPIGQKQFKRIAKNGGQIGDTVIYVAVDKKGKDLGQGFVLKADRIDPANNVAEVAGFQLAHALGIDIDIAGFDGSRSPGEMPVAIIPFAWNRAGEGGVITPNEAGLRQGGEVPNFDPRQFEGLADKAYPERLAGVLVNYFLQMGDRHDQNHMGAMVDGRPMVVPIDLGWAGRFGLGMQYNFIDYNEQLMWADPKLLSKIKTHLGKLTPEEKTRQADALKDVFDSMLGRAENIIAAGQQNYVDSILKSLSPEQRKNRNVVGAAQTKAANLFSVLTQTTENLRKRRDEVLNYFE